MLPSSLLKINECSPFFSLHLWVANSGLSILPPCSKATLPPFIKIPLLLWKVACCAQTSITLPHACRVNYAFLCTVQDILKAVEYKVPI